ncbi:MAG: hypothetical protein ACR2M4_01535 [Actinomycetota bacterium]
MPKNTLVIQYVAMDARIRYPLVGSWLAPLQVVGKTRLPSDAFDSERSIEPEQRTHERDVGRYVDPLTLAHSSFLMLNHEFNPDHSSAQGDLCVRQRAFPA